MSFMGVKLGGVNLLHLEGVKLFLYLSNFTSSSTETLSGLRIPFFSVPFFDGFMVGDNHNSSVGVFHLYMSASLRNQNKTNFSEGFNQIFSRNDWEFRHKPLWEQQTVFDNRPFHTLLPYLQDIIQLLL